MTLASIWLPAEKMLVPRTARFTTGWVMQNRSHAAGAEQAPVIHTLPCHGNGGLCFQEEDLAMPRNWEPLAASHPGTGLTAGTCLVHPPGDCNPQGYQSGSAPFTSNENCILKLYRYIPIYPKKR